MSTYEIPRNVKGEGRILFIFSTKALIYTAVAGGFGLIFYFIFNALNLKIVGIVLTLLFALIGYIIGMFKIPDNNAFKLFTKVGGADIDDVIKRAIKFKTKKKRIYVYTEEEKENESN